MGFGLAAVMLIGADILACTIYCSIRKSRAKVEKISQKSVSGDVENHETGVQKSKIKEVIKGMYKVYRRSMDSVLRPNLLAVSFIPSHTIRMLFYRYVFKMEIEKRAVIYYGAEVRAPWNIKIGRGTVVGDKAILDGRHGLVIGKNVNMSTGVSIYTMQHAVNDPLFCTVGGGVTIQDRAWLSCNSIILPCVTIAEGSVVAAGAVVTKNTEPFSVNGGVPSKKIGERNLKLQYEFDGGHLHFL